MKFKEIIEDLKREEDIKGRILLDRCKVFIIALGNDAIFLHDLCGLKLTCFGYKVCRVAVLAMYIYKYLDIIENAYAVYDYEKGTIKLILKIEYEGKKESVKRILVEQKLEYICFMPN